MVQGGDVVTFREMKPMLDPDFRKLTKVDFVFVARAIDPKSRVGGPKGKGRLTAKRALALLGVRG